MDATGTTSYLVDTNLPFAQVLQEAAPDGSLTSYTYGNDLISQESTGVISYYCYDGNSSIRQLTDLAGSVTDTYTYDAFGNILASSGVTTNNYLYTGEQFDPNSGSYYLRARYYNPQVGRFLSRDPFAGIGADSQSMPNYSYANNNPISNVDPSGKFSLMEVNASTFIAIALAVSVVADAFLTYRGVRGLLRESAWRQQYQTREEEEELYIGYRHAFGGNADKYTIPPGQIITHCYFALKKPSDHNKDSRTWQFARGGIQPDDYQDGKDDVQPVRKCERGDRNRYEYKDCVYREIGRSMLSTKWQHWQPWKNCCHWVGYVLRTCDLKWAPVSWPGYPKNYYQTYPNQYILVGDPDSGVARSADPEPTECKGPTKKDLE
jgi:RHS repeat-associated protein